MRMELAGNYFLEAAGSWVLPFSGTWDGRVLRANREDQVLGDVLNSHGLRVTWVTRSLTAGVRLELVQKVTGHRTTDIVLKHYFQPGREDFRQTLQSAMPKVLADGVLPDGHRTPKEEMRERLETVKPKAMRERLLGVWARV